MPSTWILDPLCLLPEDGGWRAARRTLEIADGRIRALHDAAPEIPPGDAVIDGCGRLAVAGFVNAHSHSPDTLLRGSAPMLPLELWSLHSAAGREARSPREIEVAALLGAVEMLRTGTTTVLDHIRISPDIDLDGLDAVARAYDRIGIRAVVAPIVADRAVVDTLPFEPGDLDGLDLTGFGARAPLPAAEQVAVVAAFVARWHDGAGGRIRAAVGPSGPQRCSDALLLAAGDLAARHGLVLHTHALETRAQAAMARRLYGGGMLAHLDALGLLGPRTNLAHAIWLDDGDIERLAARGAAVIHNPVSNARLGSGVCALPALLRHGVRVGLGTDSACCNDGGSMLETAKWSSLLHTLVTPDPDDWVDVATTLRLATSGGADAIGLGAVTGALAPGLAADITLLTLAAPAFAPLHDPVRQLVLAESGAAVERVLVAGETVLRDGRCVHVDEDALWREAQDLAERRRRDNAGVYAASARLERPIRRMYARLAAAGHTHSHAGCCR